MDDTDRKLLRLLQRDGRITNAELSKGANLSQAAPPSPRAMPVRAWPR